MQNTKKGPKKIITYGVQVGTHLRTPIYNRLKAEALKRQRSIAFLLREIVEAHVTK